MTVCVCSVLISLIFFISLVLKAFVSLFAQFAWTWCVFGVVCRCSDFHISTSEYTWLFLSQIFIVLDFNLLLLLLMQLLHAGKTKGQSWRDGEANVCALSCCVCVCIFLSCRVDSPPCTLLPTMGTWMWPRSCWTEGQWLTSQRGYETSLISYLGLTCMSVSWRQALVDRMKTCQWVYNQNRVQSVMRTTTDWPQRCVGSVSTYIHIY